MVKLKTFKRLIQLEEKGWGMYYPHVEESWIIGCHKHYKKMLLKATTQNHINLIENWWKGCLKSYNKNRIELLQYGKD